MALVQCPECQGQVSDKASVCPHCGWTLKKSSFHAVLLQNINLGEWLTLIIVLVALGVLAVLMFTDSAVVKQLKDGGYARGLITFLVSAVTVSLGFILVIQAFLGGENQADERFRRGREVFTVLAGILGTIVGFYFGTADKEVKVLSLTEPQVITTSDGKVRILASVVGGTSPYRYEIDFSAKELDDIKDKVSKDGWIVTPDLDKKFDTDFIIRITDKTDQKMEISRKIDSEEEDAESEMPDQTTPEPQTQNKTE